MSKRYPVQIAIGILIVFSIVTMFTYVAYEIVLGSNSDPSGRNQNVSASSSKKILLYTTRNWGVDLRRFNFDEDLPTILAPDGFTVTTEDRETLPVLTATILSNYDQLWFVSTESGQILSADEVQAILDFHNAGKGILVIGDGYSYVGPANQFSSALDVQFVSSQCWDCDHCGGPIGCAISTSGFVPHVIWNNVSQIEANLNEGDLSASAPAQVIAIHNGIRMVAIRDADGGRVAWDATVYRFTDASYHPNVAITHYDNAQYAQNLACWLAGETCAIPTLTEWGLIIFGAALLGFITWVFLRKRQVIGVRL